MLGTVETKSVSPVFVGRDGELTALTEALARAAAGQPQALLVGGEAGVGKTRLIEELISVACRDGAVVAVGGCVEIGGDGLPFAPFSAALRGLRRLLPEEIAAAADGQEGELARILPELGPSASDALGEHGTASLFELTVRLLERVAADRTVVLILEDLHWADASTRHLLAYLFRTLRRGRLLVITTYRTDDIHRRHPLRPLLAELDRLRTVSRIELSRFSRAEVRRQLHGILGDEPAPQLVDEIFGRSDGNAFFVEELAVAIESGCRSGLTDSLRDLLLVRVETLPENAQRVARIVAEGGATVEFPLLLAVAQLSEDDLIDALRAAVGANILLPVDGDGYRFRHSLVREAISDDLLPGERSRLNRRLAEALEADPSLVRGDESTTRLAGYWYHAHDAAKALPVVLLASVEARRRYAHAEQLRLLERAMELWDAAPEDIRACLRPPDDTEVYPPTAEGASAPLRYLDLLAEATVAARSGGERERALALSKKAMRVLETVDDPLRAAWFWTQRSRLVQDLTRGDGWDELATAQDLVRGLPPSAVHASVLSDVASWGALHRPGPNSLAAADRAVEYARLVGAEHIELNARATRGWLATESGSIEEGLAEMYAVRDRVFELGNLGTLGILGRISINLPSTLESVGRSEEAVAAAELGITLCHQRGLSDKEAWVRVNLSESLFALGRWNESRTAIDEAAWIAHAPKARALVAVRRALLALGRGDAAEAASQVTLARAVFGPHDPQPQHVIAPARLAMVSAARQGRLAEARAEFEQVAAQGFPPGMQRYALPLLCSAAAMEADARGLPEADAGRAAILAIVRDHAKRLPALVPIWRAYDLLLEAELARADGIVAPKLWARAVAAFEALPRPYELAEARHRWAADLLAASADREQATALLIQAHAAAKRLGARHLVEETELLAGRARISLSTTPELAPAPAPETDAVSSLGLTPREQDVLRRVADGLSNRQIAEELYISPKTASVHVSNILAKLGVSGRTEAAAMTHRLHLFSDLEPTRT
ncbi:Transcriptional regulatory protein LiaR [Streptomyces sp. S4.7]|uniref:helix-turn-helix transcriptional regulator n=1 Tax=Streptomyces sp. S4.7 TaxID=2705439 RepID=UPI00139927DB|nr:helix-turn-helix transcriptional regulator [Streptomyces sp. S4.7]QHY98335.1 Transcriptional regulatory protein LiaR [Streptomyces sp. S4.7]